MKLITSFLLLFILHQTAFSAYPTSDTPYSVRYKKTLPTPSVLVMKKPAVAPLMALRKQSLLKNELIPSATVVHAGINPNTHGTWTTTPDGYKIWQLEVILPGAFGTATYYDRFNLTEGTSFYVSDGQGGRVFGYGPDANPGNDHFSTPVIAGHKCLFELNVAPGVIELPVINIEGLAYFFVNEGVKLSSTESASRAFGDAEDCHININCPEGDDWQGEKRAVVRILTRVGSSAGWCTGTILNNTYQDCTPYILTADHCREIDGQKSNTSDFDQYQFYFGYEGPECSKPKEADVPVGVMTGAVFRAGSTSSGDTDSDFLLVELKTEIPSFYNPVFAGWYNQNFSSASGVMIHHPAGDIKKISTFTQPTQSASWANKVMNTHWKVRWAQTETGKGVSQGGSSGSALFNDLGYVVGHLTGGNTSCVDSGGFSPNGYDMFGKFSYSYLWHNHTPSENLFNWLDAGNSHVAFLASIAWPCSELPIGENELTAPEKNPLLYPNPTRDLLHIELPKAEALSSLELRDVHGRTLQILDILPQQTISIAHLMQGIYFLHFRYTDGNSQVKKLVVQD
jgi:hypothetical protein